MGPDSVNLTPREREVLEAIRAGARSYPAIAEVLEVSVHTAEAHARRIAEKVGPLGPGPLLTAIVYAIQSPAREATD